MPYITARQDAGLSPSPAAADAALFEGRIAVVTPARATPAADAEAIGGCWAALGSTVFMIDPKEHDKLLAATSHAPHLIAAAIALATPAAARQFTAGGWRDTTRIPAGDPELWADILLDNAAQVAKALSPEDVGALASWLSAQALPANAHPAPPSEEPMPLRCGSAGPGEFTQGRPKAHQPPGAAATRAAAPPEGK